MTHSFDRPDDLAYAEVVEVHFPPELQAKLEHVAARQGRDSETIVREAVERLVDYDAWFVAEVDKGLAAADRGEFIKHDDIGQRIRNRFPG